jgi:hypothetical protein
MAWQDRAAVEEARQLAAGEWPCYLLTLTRGSL